MEEDKDQKTEEPTSKRLTDAEDKGNFAHSREMTSAFILMMATLSFIMAGSFSTKHMMGTWHNMISQVHTIQLTVNEMQGLLGWTAKNIMIILSPVLLSIMLGGVVANLFQTGGFKVSAHPLTPKFNKLNPLTGVKRLFSKNSVMELFKSIFKIAVISWIAFITIKGHFAEIPPMMGLSVGQILAFLGRVMIEIMIKVLLMIILIALIDFAFQKFTYTENLRMTKQQVKDERKDTEGNPQIKQRIRTVQLEMMRKRMMAAVPEADVVVTNPTHFSIAIKYDRNKHEAPVVVAKGQGDIALKIREIAKENDVPLVEDKPLARLLYKSVEIGQIIPTHLYRAVAEILAYVYKLKGIAGQEIKP
ncbi:MAG: flagellar biosynthesis protein FlhB [Candidatus Nitronauta litoralis]|uniref:Flagellar biosynthetic protein FlhB n=1 Tax=Candidatus Nitronauta litoralis TaxID=2705533 RepID=A0A7T0BXH1_9BACT|nr:MAG: flagellar biosynthesis protein FlhB [Candidatus Nitronauta litoralis]